MAWVRIHDGALSHPKIVGMVDTRRPFDLWVWGLSYAQLHLTDGRIPNDALPRGVWKAVHELCRRRLWEAQDEGFIIHDHLEWNDSRDVVTTRKKDAKKRKQEWWDRHQKNADGTRSECVGNVTHNQTKPNQTKPVQEEIHRETERRISGTGDPTIARRAGDFFEVWSKLFSEHRSGATYHGRPAIDYANCCNLVRSFPDDDRLRDLAVVFLNSNEPFIESSNRSLAVFETRISWCDEQLRKAEAQQRRSN